jgi:N-acetylmuramic acid 6-phosphate etherase
MAQVLPAASVHEVDSRVAALVGGSGTRRGILLIVGTEVAAYGENERGEQAQSGGWGHLLDRGGAYHLAREALVAVTRAADGGRPPSSLTGRALGALGLEEPRDLSRRLHDPLQQSSTVAALAPLVLAEAEAGDLIATGVVAAAADALADTAETVARRLGLRERPFPVVLGGSLLAGSAFYRDAVTQSLRTRLPGARPQPPRADGAVGAARLALESLGYPLSDESPAEQQPHHLWASEQVNVFTRDLDLRNTEEIVGFMHIEDQRAAAAVGPVLPEVAAAVDAIAVRMRQGGRLIYVGGGTSGRLGVLDASEAPATFNAPPDQVVGVMAGGPEAVRSHGLSDEDDAEAGRRAMVNLTVSPLDSVVGITASGRTPFTVAAMEEARGRGALTVALVCNLPAPLAERADHVIAPLVGPEVLTGSTRLKAGTAQKLVLNMLSTAVMVRLGKIYGNLMVDVRQDNEKLRDRARRIVAQICGVDEEEAAEALERTEGEVKAAVLCILTGVSPSAARERLALVDNVLRAALAQAGPS